MLERAHEEIGTIESRVIGRSSVVHAPHGGRDARRKISLSYFRL
jgi:hypothetical protein